MCTLRRSAQGARLAARSPWRHLPTSVAGVTLEVKNPVLGVLAEHAHRRMETDMLDDKTAAELSQVLQDELTRLEAVVFELDRAERESQSEASGENVYRDHMADQGTATLSREMDMTFEENERELLEEVRAALARMERPAPTAPAPAAVSKIPAARLQAVPTASLCILCKEAEESR